MRQFFGDHLRKFGKRVAEKALRDREALGPLCSLWHPKFREGFEEVLIERVLDNLSNEHDAEVGFVAETTDRAEIRSIAERVGYDVDRLQAAWDRLFEEQAIASLTVCMACEGEEPDPSLHSVACEYRIKHIA
jgi:hypothetical protein